MSKGLIITLAIVAFIGIVGMGGCSYVKGKYNKANTMSFDVDEKWADVQSSYQRRFDLLGNLVATVEASANFEKSTMTEVAKAQASVGAVRMTASANHAPATQEQLDEFASRQQMLGTALSRLMVVQYKFPDLKSTEQFRDLQAQIEGTENRIKYSRAQFNAAVKPFNTYINDWIVPPFSLKSFGWTEKPFFKTQSAEAEMAPKIQFNSLVPSTPAK